MNNSNRIFTQTLGLAPLLIMSNSLEHALLMASFTALVLLLSAAAYALIQNSLAHHLRLIFMAATVASLVTLLQLSLQTFRAEWAISMGLLLPLIASHSLIYGVLEQSESRSTLFKNSFTASALFFVAIMSLALIRQVLGSSSFADIPFFLLPAGALLSFAGLIALYNVWQQRHDKTIVLIDSQTRRQRVTGRIA